MIQKAMRFLKDVRVEMAKVSWPSKEELKGSTVIVIVVSLLFAGFIFLADQILSRLVNALFRVGGAL